LKALQTASSNLALDDKISETPFSLEVKIAKKWHPSRFELMENFDYHDSLVERSTVFDFSIVRVIVLVFIFAFPFLLYFALLGRSGLKIRNPISAILKLSQEHSHSLAQCPH
jgi:hypothetical protein